MASQVEASARAIEIRDAMRHSWRGYREVAWGHDDVKSVSGSASDWCKMAVTMVDALSTLWLMELYEEFDAAQDYLVSSPIPSPGRHGTHSLFETVIRVLGGLLGAYSLSGRQVFLEAAVRVGDRLMPAFNTTSGFPDSVVDVGTGEHSAKKSYFVLAEIGSLQLEFRFLSHASGNSTYAKTVDKVLETLFDLTRHKGLLPVFVQTQGHAALPERITLGACGDSYYEYLLKQWIQSGKRPQDRRLIDTWKLAMKETMDGLVCSTAGGLTFIDETKAGKRANRMDHLVCFAAGMLMLGHHELPAEEVDPRWWGVAENLTSTCYEMYRRAPTGLSPEYAIFVPTSHADDMVAPKGDAAANLLRPETAEALFYMHYYTGDPKYRQWAYQLFAAFEKHCKARYGYTSIRNGQVMPVSCKDSQESFWLAETLKYLYLVMMPRDLLDLNVFVLSTEGHPFRRWK